MYYVLSSIQPKKLGDSQYCLLIDDQLNKSFVWYVVSLEEDRASIYKHYLLVGF
jgi:hypothetical protein